jgi:hypothetical protein
VTFVVAFLVCCSAAVFLAHSTPIPLNRKTRSVEKSGGFCVVSRDRRRGTRFKSATLPGKRWRVDGRFRPSRRRWLASRCR